MNPKNVKIQFGRWPGPVRVIGPLRICTEAERLHKHGTEIPEMITALQALAAERGANAVIYAAYEISMSVASWQSFALGGMAVVTGISEKPIGTDLASQLVHTADLLDRGIITYDEYEEKIACLRRDHERRGKGSSDENDGFSSV